MIKSQKIKYMKNKCITFTFMYEMIYSLYDNNNNN